jgi:hypothetical protein
MKRNARKILSFFNRHGVPALSATLFAACLVAAIGGKWFAERELYKAKLTPLPDGAYEFTRTGVWVAEGCVGFSKAHIVLTAGERASWFRRPGDPPGVWMWDDNPPGTRFKVDPMTGLRPFRYETDIVRHGPPGFPGPRTWFNARVPLWPFILLFGYLPVRKAIAWCRGRRAYAAGHCTDCGYDLRFSPRRCPECGRAVTNCGSDLSPPAPALP